MINVLKKSCFPLSDNACQTVAGFEISIKVNRRNSCVGRTSASALSDNGLANTFHVHCQRDDEIARLTRLTLNAQQKQWLINR